MRALVCNQFGPPDSLQIEQLDDPVPGPGEVLVDVQAAGINFPDLLVIGGQYQVRTDPPFVPGGECAGIVAATGEGVKRYKPGDRVIGITLMGAFAEKCVVPETRCLPLPESLSFEQGAGFTVTYATSWHAFHQSTELQDGETVLVLGAAGGVGITAVEIASALGARVIAAASSEEKLQFAREAGADEVINYSESDLRQAVKEITGGKGVNVVYDPVGGDIALQALKSLAWNGRYLVIGFASGSIPDVPANLALLKEARIIGVWWGTWSERNPEASCRNRAALAGMDESGQLTPRVTGAFPLDDFAQAFAAIAERRARGKIVLTMA